MKVLVCGGRSYLDHKRVFEVLDGLRPKHVIHGGASGADRCANDWALVRGVRRSIYPADWTRHGRAAGPRRNQLMLDKEKPDLVVAFPGGRETADMVSRARAAGVRVMEID
jgi:hypothetical protein